MRFSGRYFVIVTVFVLFIWLIYEFWIVDSSVIVVNEKWEETIWMRRREVNETINCPEYLNSLQALLTVKVLLIDVQILKLIGKGRCDQLNGINKRIKVATNSRKDLLTIDHKMFEPIYFASEDEKDYLEFETSPERIIPKNFESRKFGNLAVPLKPFRFREFWKNSEFMECMNLTMHRNLTKPRVNPEKAFIELSKLRDLLVEYDMFPIISEGTLLGWYRECSLIPHTNDVDINVFADEFNPKLFREMKEGKTRFKIIRRMGKLEDGLEYTVSSREGYKVYTDIFLMYEAKNKTANEKYNWIGSLCGDGERIHLTFPLLRPLCALDLHGHIFWATCDPRKDEYGENWKKDLDSKTYNETFNCPEYLNSLQALLTVKVLLIDDQVLELIGKGRCDQLHNIRKSIKVATNSRKDMLTIDQQKFEPVYFESNDKNDYWEFETKPRRIIPKNLETQQFGSLSVPLKPFRFKKLWENSEFVQCLNLTMDRNLTTPRVNPEKAFFELSKLRDLLVEYDMFPIISEGTLLGWYRECSIIPHTHDLDMSVFVEEYNPKLFDYMKKGNTEFKILRRFGRLEDGLEYTVESRDGYKVLSDIFLIYESKNETTKEKYNYIGGLNGNGERVRFTFPLFRPLCALDLHGHIFWATCDPRKALEYEYGEDWKKDFDSIYYVWNRTPKNVKVVGWYTSEEMKDVFLFEG